MNGYCMAHIGEDKYTSDPNFLRHNDKYQTKEDKYW
jgi:hypothetical protein